MMMMLMVVIVPISLSLSLHATAQGPCHVRAGPRLLNSHHLVRDADPGVLHIR